MTQFSQYANGPMPFYGFQPGMQEYFPPNTYEPPPHQRYQFSQPVAYSLAQTPAAYPPTQTPVAYPHAQTPVVFPHAQYPAPSANVAYHPHWQGERLPVEKDDDEVRVVRGVHGSKRVNAWKTFEEVRAYFPQGLVDILTDGRVASFLKPTNVQAYSWPTLLAGEDMISIAKTGSGKTLAFLLPGFIRVKQRELRAEKIKGPQICVLAPTRELCQQIYVESVKFGEPANIFSACAYGGGDKGPQLRKFHRGPQVAIGCPGRLLDYLNRGEVDLSNADYFVLDEGDRMLDMGFEPQIRMILNHLPCVRQNLLFSATWPKEVQHVARSICGKDAVHIQVGTADSLTANADITQHVIFVQDTMDKWNHLKRILADNIHTQSSSVLVFSNTKVGCADLARGIKRNLRIFASALHGDMDQKSRDNTLQRFKEGRDQVMVATDVAQRGLDVRNVAIVINWDVPTNPEDYVHRIGRTGRSGDHGVSWAFLTKEEIRMAQEIMRLMQKSGQTIPQDLLDVVGTLAPRGKKGKKGLGDKGGKGFGKGGDKRGIQDKGKKGAGSTDNGKKGGKNAVEDKFACFGKVDCPHSFAGGW